MFEEYRYDALGRRVLVRSRADTYCPERCRNTLQRTVWDGDQVLIEISAPGATNTAAAMMEADTGLARYSPFNHKAEGFFYGRVVYVHGQGIDQPLATVRYEYSDSIPNPVMLLPHTNVRGGVDTASYVTPCFSYTITLTRLEEEGDTIGMPKAQTHCLETAYPARYELSSRESVAQDRYGPVSWMGSLITGNRDATGQTYNRNRYYDPKSGRFTQEDPIGLAGGVNLYGFAAGDPVNFADPYGLCSPTDLRDCTHEQMQNMLGVAHRIPWYNDPLLYLTTGAVELSARAGTGLAGRAAGSLAERGLARLAMINSRNPLQQIQFVGRMVGRLKVGQNAAAGLITATLNRLGYEIGEEVVKDGARYLISKTVKNGVSHAFEILEDGTVNAVRVRGFGPGITVIR